jgi:hypothetical protein
MNARTVNDGVADAYALDLFATKKLLQEAGL